MELACVYEIAESHHILENWNDSIKYCEEFLAKNKAPSYACWCAFMLGLSYCMIGENEKAVIAFQKTPPLARKVLFAIFWQCFVFELTGFLCSTTHLINTHIGKQPNTNKIRASQSTSLS